MNDDLHAAAAPAFVRRVALLGGESAGKTTLAQALADDLIAFMQTL
jgi:nicotinamide riboside kinase